MSEADPDLLAEFNALTGQAARYRRYSYGARSGSQRTDEEGPTCSALMSRHLLLIDHMVKCHPELKGECKNWVRVGAENVIHLMRLGDIHG